MSFDSTGDHPPDVPPTRELTDPRAMRALAHPTRLDLLELLAREGELTATRAGELLGLSAANCSFHLRQLAKYGFVEETGGARGRNRPWRVVSLSHRWSESGADVAAAASATMLSLIVWERELARAAEFLARQSDEPEAWREAAFGSTGITYLTVAELTALGQAVEALLLPYLGRLGDPQRRPADARPVSFVAASFPLEPTPSGA